MQMRITAAGWLLVVLGLQGSAHDEVPSFGQIWAYLYKGEERVLTGTETVTDLFYFSAQVGHTGRLEQRVTRPDLDRVFTRPVKVHLVVSAPANRALMYFCLSRDRQTRDALLADIISAAKDFDGVQVDFEGIGPEDGQAFLTFLALLEARLEPGKVLSVAVPARTADRQDAYDYKAIGQIVDKVLVMAYDEHWSRGEPGPVASPDWCRRVCAYALSRVPAWKLVMGLPLYGRAWQLVEFSRALRFEQTMELLRSLGKVPSRTDGQVPFFEYLEPVRVKIYYEDQQSLLAKLQIYKALGVKAVGFWRLGQGPQSLWDQLSIAGLP